MDRREMIQSSAAFALAAASSAATAQAAKPADHSQHGGKYAALSVSTADCIRICQAGLAHCVVLLGQGDKSMGNCAISLSETLATCDALLRLASSESKYVPKMATLSMAILDECEKECRLYEKKHKSMKDSADACAACSKECRKVSA